MAEFKTCPTPHCHQTWSLEDEEFLLSPGQTISAGSLGTECVHVCVAKQEKLLFSRVGREYDVDVFLGCF